LFLDEIVVYSIQIKKNMLFSKTHSMLQQLTVQQLIEKLKQLEPSTLLAVENDYDGFTYDLKISINVKDEAGLVKSLR
jgi:hypothetical protein